MSDLPDMGDWNNEDRRRFMSRQKLSRTDVVPSGGYKFTGPETGYIISGHHTLQGLLMQFRGTTSTTTSPSGRLAGQGGGQVMPEHASGMVPLRGRHRLCWI
jgi:hypothetical protein